MWPLRAAAARRPGAQPGARRPPSAPKHNRRRCCRSAQTSPLLHLGTASLIQQKLTFPNSGPAATPGVIVERIDDTVGPDVDPKLKGMVIVFNATPQRDDADGRGDRQGQNVLAQPLPGRAAATRSSGPPPSTRTTGAFTVPARTVAVFEQH